MKELKIISTAETGEGTNTLAHGRPFVAFRHVDAEIMACDHDDPALDGFIPADHYQDLLERRIAEEAGVGRDIASEALRNGAWSGEDVALKLNGDVMEVSRGEHPVVGIPLTAAAAELGEGVPQ